MDNSVSCGEEARGRESDPLIKMNGILEPGKRMVGLCKDLNHVASCFCFAFPLQQEEALLLFFWKHRAPKSTGNLCCARLCSEGK